MRRFAAACLAVALAFVAGACDEAPSSPAEAFAAVRSTLPGRDGKALYAVIDGDSIGYFRGLVREWRALVARGDDPVVVLHGAPVTPEELNAGTEEDIVAMVLGRSAPIMTDGAWYLGATVVAEERDTPETARLKLRGADGVEKELWFVEERGSWRYDHFRTSWPQ